MAFGIPLTILSPLLVFFLLVQLTRSGPIALPNSSFDQRSTRQQLVVGSMVNAKYFSVLFGSAKKPWRVKDWIEVSDTVRGGSSTAMLVYLEPSDRAAGIRFQGTLDTKTLGGAGFASQAYRHPISLSDKQYTGFFIELDPLSSDVEAIKHFTFTAKNVLPSHTPDGRQNSSLSYEFDFTVPSASTLGSERALEQLVRFEIPFGSLKPTYRGRPQPEAKPFDPHHITELSFMCRSFFNQQSGPFRLDVLRLGAIGTGPHQHDAETRTSAEKL